MQETNSSSLSSQAIRYQFEELKERASKDALSGLLNRSTAEIYISQRLKDMRAEGFAALFIIDLDTVCCIMKTDSPPRR